MLADAIRKKASRRKAPFTREIFSGLGSYDAIGREFRTMVTRGELVQRGRGIYQAAPKEGSPASLRNAADLIADQIKQSGRLVFTRADFSAPVSYDALGRALSRLTREGRLLRIAPGLYAKARKSRISGNPVPAGSPEQVVREAADRLGAKVVESPAQRGYNSGRSTQVPTGRMVTVEGKPRVRRLRKEYAGSVLIFQHQPKQP